MTELNAAIDLAFSYTGEEFVVCEEYLDEGIEVSIEAFVVDGKPYITGIAQRHFLKIDNTYPNFVEYGGTMPPFFSDALIEQCESTFINAIEALGITGGPSKGDLLIRNGEVFVLEITSRTSPGFAAEMQPLSSGVTPLMVLIKWATGKPVTINELKPKFQKGVAHRYLIHTPGKVTLFKGLQELKNSSLIDYCLELNIPRIGDHLASVNYMNRILYIITSDIDNKTASEKADKALELIKIEVE